MKSFEDSSSNSDIASTYNSLYSASSFSPPTPPPSTSTPTITPPNFNMPPPPIRPKTRTGLSLNAEEFVPSTPYSSIGYPTYGDTNECKYTIPVGNRSAGVNTYQFPPNLQTPLNFNNPTQNQLLIQQQQILQEKQQLMQRQQELAAAAVARQKFLLSATATAKHPPNEIANSLKMLAFLSSPAKGNETSQFPVEEVMQEFATNGYTTDDFNRYQQATNSMHMFTNNNVFQNAHNTLHPSCYGQNLNSFNNPNMNMGWLYNPQQILNDNLSVYNEILRQNFLQLLPQHLMRQAEAVNAAATVAAINMDYNRQNKPFKKGFYKKDSQLTARRCVFCENNKEPEEVIKSHAVRDSQGRVLCPKLRIYVCPICKASGDDAHTVKYCPQKPITTMDDTLKAEFERRYKTGGFTQAKSSNNMKA